MDAANPAPVLLQSDAWWQFGLFVGTMPQGTVRLYDSGRVEFKLNTGDMVFSCPAALIRFKSLPGVISFVVGSRNYNVQFYSQYTKNAYSGDAAGSAQQNPDVRSLVQNWLNQLSAAQTKQADNEPIIALANNKHLKEIKRISLMAFAGTVGFAVILAVAASAYAIARGQDANSYRGVTALIVVVTYPIIFGILNRLRLRSVRQMSQEAAPNDPSSILPPGTKPTGKPLTLAKQLFWALAIVTFVVIIVLGIIYLLVHK